MSGGGKVLDTELAEQLLKDAGRDAQGVRQGSSLPVKHPKTQQCFDLVAQKQGLTKIGVLRGELAAPLRRMDVAFNNLTSLWGVEQMTNLRVLCAYSNPISDINGLRGVSRLECLRLQQCAITELVDHFTSMKKLRELRLDHNNLTRLDNYLSCCSSLRSLDLSSNRIISLEGLAGLQSLEELRVSNNSVRSLLPLRSLPCLVSLDVSHNKLASLEGLQNLNMLETLHAEQNQIKSLRISQTYSRGNKALGNASTPMTLSLSLSAAAAASASKKAAAAPPTPTTDAVLGMAYLSDVFLEGNTLTNLEGLDTLGVAIETLDLRSNQLEADHNTVSSSLYRLKKLAELRLEANESLFFGGREGCFYTELSATIAQHCPALKRLDDQNMAAIGDESVGGAKRKKGAKNKKQQFHTWDDASTVATADDDPSLAGGEGDAQQDEDSSDDEGEEDLNDDVDDDFNSHNKGLNAPTLSLKAMKTPEELAAMETSFKSLLTSCKDTLFTFLLNPDKVLESSNKPVVVVAAAPEAKTEAMRQSEEETASLFHPSSVEAVSGFRDNVDHRGDLIRGSQLADDNGKKETVKRKIIASRIEAKVVDVALAPSASLSSLAQSSTATSISSTSNNKGPRSPLTESRRYTTSDKVLLGSGLTRHGTKIKHKGLVDPLVELLQSKHAYKGLMDLPEQLLNSSVSSERLNSAQDDAQEEDVEEEHHENQAGHGQAAFLTATPSNTTLAPGPSFSAGVGCDARQEQEEEEDLRLAPPDAGFSRFKAASGSAATKLGVRGISGLDTRFLASSSSSAALDQAGSNSARSLPSRNDANRVGTRSEEDMEIDKVIEKLKHRRRLSEPLLVAAKSPHQLAPQASSSYDDSDDDDEKEDYENGHDGLHQASVSSTSSLSRSSAPAATAKPLKNFRTPVSRVDLEQLERALLRK